MEDFNNNHHHKLLSSSLILSAKSDLFLCFRGRDTGSNFTAHLFKALKVRGIQSIGYDQNRKPIAFDRIHECWCSIIILSSTFASSSRCLDELAEIMERHKNAGLTVYPVFYCVDPSDVRNRKRKFEEAFAYHDEHNASMKIIGGWKAALTDVANLSGWSINGTRPETDVINDIIQEIQKKLTLRDTCSTRIDGLVGIHDRWKELQKKLCLDSNDVRFIGICGMGGIGKTTLARFGYEAMATQFEGHSFHENVREQAEKGKLASVQKQLLSQLLMGESIRIYDKHDGANMIRDRLCNRKVLVVIDDVDDDMEHLKYLAGDYNWFGPGSRIIITSRDEHLLMTCGVEMDNIFKPQLLNFDEAQKLFRLKAFKSEQLNGDFMNYCDSVVEYAGGLPLALEVLGSFLWNRDAHKWKSAIERLKSGSPNNKIFDALKISFDGLQDPDKRIFLDIACFFNGMSETYVKEQLESFNFDPVIGICVLIERSLLTIDHEKKLRMHDRLQDMGRKIVEQESPSEPGRRSRLWKEDDIRHVLTENTVQNPIHVEHGVFLNMKGLRLLRLKLDVVTPHGLIYLPRSLQSLEWYSYWHSSSSSLKSLVLPSSFEPYKLVRLQMSVCSIEKLWEGTKLKHLPELKSIKISNCQHLTETPCLTHAPNLQILNFDDCEQLFTIHPSMGLLKNLTKLSFTKCVSLRSLPEDLGSLKSLLELDASFTSITELPSISGLNSLKILYVSSCRKLDKLPDDLGSLKNLLELDASRTTISDLPSTIVNLQSLQLLDLDSCENLNALPNVSGLNSLKKLSVFQCSKLDNLPEDLGSLKSLLELDANGTAITKLPSTIVDLQKLEKLDLRNCKNLKALPSGISGLKSLMPEDIDVSGCSNLESLPEDIDDNRFIELSDELCGLHLHL